LSIDRDTAAADDLTLRFDVLKLDYERTLALLDGISRSRTTIRAAALTAFVTFLGLSVQQRTWPFAAAGALLALAFAAFDSHQGWLYHAALRRGNRIERLFQQRLRALSRPYDDYPIERLEAEFERYEFGALSQLPRFRWAALRKTVDSSQLVAYVVPVVGAVVCAFLVG